MAVWVGWVRAGSTQSSPVPHCRRGWDPSSCFWGLGEAGKRDAASGNSRGCINHYRYQKAIKQQDSKRVSQGLTALRPTWGPALQAEMAHGAAGGEDTARKERGQRGACPRDGEHWTGSRYGVGTSTHESSVMMCLTLSWGSTGKYQSNSQRGILPCTAPVRPVTPWGQCWYLCSQQGCRDTSREAAESWQEL